MLNIWGLFTPRDGASLCISEGESPFIQFTLLHPFISRYNPQCALSLVQPLEPWGNTVYGYAT